jgi:hypothetical protein
MLIRQKYHWIVLCNTALFFVLAIFIWTFKNDTFMVPFYFFVATVCAICWSSSYTTLSNGLLKTQVLFFTYKSIPVSNVSRIVPHKMSGKWGYGGMVNIYSNDGEKLTLQPNRPQPFLEMLREQAPQAAYLL